MRSKTSPVKSNFQVYQLAQSAEILFGLFSEISRVIAPGWTGMAIQTFALKYLAERGARPALRGEEGFPADVSVSVNDIAAHGVPNNEAFKPGDLVTVDCVLVHKGWYGDMAWTYGIAPLNVSTRRLIAAAWQSCLRGCLSLKSGTSMGTLGTQVIKAARGLGARVVNEFCGHGIGRSLHEAPLIPYTPRPGYGWKAQKGMTLNIEPVLTLGDPAVVPAGNGVSYRTKDGRPSAQYELTCLVNDGEARILSLPGLPSTEVLEYPPFF